MTKKEFVSIVKQQFEVLPTKQEIKKYMLENNIDVSLNSSEIIQLLVTEYNKANKKPRVTKATTRTNNTKRYTKEQIEELIAKGYKHVEIAKMFNMSESKLTKMKSAYGIQRRQRKRDWDEVKDYAKEHTYQEIAVKYNINLKCVSRLMLWHGIEAKLKRCKDGSR